MTIGKSSIHAPRSMTKGLREARKRRGISPAELADKLQRTQSWISLLERGQISLTPEVIDRWSEALHLSMEERDELIDDFSREHDKYITWRLFWTGGADKAQQERGEWEDRAQHLRLFQPTIINGLLQIPRYIEAIYYATGSFADDSQLTSYVQARLARQAILNRASKQIDVLMTEAALRSMVASSDVMAMQMAHIARLSEWGLVEVAIIPFTARLTVLPHSNWDIFDESIAFVELVTGQVTFTESSELTRYIDTFEAMWESAIRGDDARDFLGKLVREYERYE